VPLPVPGDVVEISMFDRSYRIVNPGRGRVGSKLAQGEPYERKLLVDCHQQHLTGTAFDVGAHIGNHTLFLAAVCGLRVHAWEPHDRSREMLLDNLALNPTLDVTVHDWAAGAGDGRGRFTPGMWIEFDPDRDGAAVKLDRGDVTVHSIDDHLDVDDLAVMKVDVEGMEPHVIAGAIGHIERCHPVIYAETHTPAAHADVAALLEPLGYQMTRGIRMGSPMERWQHPAGPRSHTTSVHEGTRT
jgi:FkbM family methyltransferase